MEAELRAWETVEEKAHTILEYIKKKKGPIDASPPPKLLELPAKPCCKRFGKFVSQNLRVQKCLNCCSDRL